MIAFFTVGSTKFDSLVEAAFSTGVLSSLHRRGYTDVIIQCGNSTFNYASSIEGGITQTLLKDDVRIEFWKFKPSLQAEFEKADLVISHAGSGTILDVLRLGKPLIVVPNPTLLDNHQQELAFALSELGHLKASPVADVAKTIEGFDISSVIPFPPFDSSRFARVMDEEMGFV